jgi:hypothetical protein
MLQRIRVPAGIAAIVAVMALAVAVPRLVLTSGSSAAIPTGDVLLLNSSNCITLGSALGGLDTLSAVADCQNIQQQFSPSPGSLAHFVACLRGSVVDGQHLCISPDTVGQVVPGDFTKIDLDRDQAHYGQDLLVLAFVTSDNPVTFSTDAGTLIDRAGVSHGQQWFCETGDAGATPSGDPDCDGLPGTVGDGVVIAKLRVDATTPRGTHHLIVTQAGVDQLRDFHVVGIPASISFTTLAGKTSIETGATAPISPAVDRSPTDCIFGLTDALTGLPDRPEKAVVVAKALDSDGNEVVGSLLQWDHPFVATNGSPVFGPLPQGGVALPQVPTIDLGAAGIGFPQVVCGGATPGLLTEDVSLSDALNPLEDPSIHAGYSIDVVPATVHPTTPCLAPADCSPHVLAINSSICAALGSFALNALQDSAAADCGQLQRQHSPSGSVQHLVRCLRGAVNPVFGTRDCVPPTSQPVQIGQADFAAIDLDRNQLHAGQDLLVLAFVPQEDPVTFETDAGAFLADDRSVLGASYACQTGNYATAPYMGDPDCDNNSATPGDGVVVARLHVDASTPRGVHHVFVTQAGVTQEADFTVVGPPATIEFATLAGRTSVTVGATVPTFPVVQPLPTDCWPPSIAESLTGLPDHPEKAVAAARVLDSDGNDVVGAALVWSHPFFPMNVDGNVLQPLPQGGVFPPSTITFDLGSSGVAALTLVCGGATTGTLTEDVNISNAFNSNLPGNPIDDPSIHAAYSIEVVPAGTRTHTSTPTPTRTPTATSTSTSTPTATATATPTATSTSTATATTQPARRGGGGARATSTALPSPVATATSTAVHDVLPIVATPRPRPPVRIVLPDTGRGPAGGDHEWSVLPVMIAAGALLLVVAGVRLRRRHTRIG